jgi:hypothetical protein
LPEPSLEPEGEEYDDFDIPDAIPLNTSQILASARYQMEAERLQRWAAIVAPALATRSPHTCSPGKRADKLRAMVNRCARWRVSQFGNNAAHFIALRHAGRCITQKWTLSCTDTNAPPIGA